MWTWCWTRWPVNSSTPRCGLVAPGGVFLEMGKTDIREPDAIAREYPGVRYRAFDLFEAGADHIEGMLTDLARAVRRRHAACRCR